MSFQTALDHAVKATTAAAALDRLLVAWALNPAAELEDAIIALDHGSPFQGDQSAFVKAAKTASPSQRGPLLTAATTGTLAEVTRRLELLAAWPADPRTSRRLLELLSSVPWSSDSSKPAWTAAFALMVKQNDARFVAAAKTLPTKWKVRASMQQWLERAFGRAAAQLEPPTAAPLSAKEKAALARVLKAHATPPKPKAAAAKDEASLLAAVFAAPEDDAPRAVLADLLQEKNDPRGEFIALQLANDPKATKLVKVHGKTWLGALGPVLAADVEFRRGFPAVGRTKFRHQADAEQYGALPDWATFEELEWGTPTPIPRGQEPFCRFIGPAFRHLRVARGPHLPSVLAAKEPWALEALEVSLKDSSELVALGEALPKRLPRLKRLTVSNMQGEWFRGVKHLDRLAELTVRGAAQQYTRGWEVLRALPVEALTLSTGASRWCFARGESGVFSKLTLHLADAENALRHEDLARLLPTGFLESFELVTGKKPDPKAVASIRRALEAAQKRWAGAKAKGGPVVTPMRALMRTFLIRDLPGGERVVVDVEGVQVLAKGTTDVVHLHGTSAVGAAVNAEGTRLAVATWRGLEVLTLPGLERVWQVASAVEDVRGVQFQGAAVWLFARTGSERFDANTGALQEKFGPATRLLGVSSDGAFALRFAKAGGFEVGALGARAALAVPGQLAAFVAGDEVLVVEGPQGTGPLSLKRVDPRTQQVTASVTTLAVEGVPFDLSVSPAGTSVLVGIDPGFVTVDVASLGATLTKERLRGFAGFASEAVCVAVNEDGALETVSRPRRQ